MVYFKNSYTRIFVRLFEQTIFKMKDKSTFKVLVPNAEQVGASSPAVTAVGRMLDILDAFQRVQKPLSLTELAKITAIPKSSCHAIVATLIARGFLYSLTRPRALYPTRRLLDVARDIHAHDPFVENVMPLLEQLRDSTQETIILGKRQGNSVIYLEVFESPNSIRYSSKSGEFKPLHASAIGKALMGSLKETELRAQLLGRDFTRGENVPDVWAVSAFLNVNSETLAVSVAGPRHRMENNVIEHAQQLLSTCGMISRQLAWN
jgi:DNA-binding IclR family transcriptional regulator